MGIHIADFLLIMPFILCVFYGLWRGVRRSLCLLIVLMLSFLVSIIATSHFEEHLLRRVGMEASTHSGVPAVASFMLAGRMLHAYVAAMIPSFIALTFLIIFVAADMSFPYGTGFREPGAVISGAIAGIFGTLFMLLQLLRLPLPVPGRTLIYFREVIERFVPTLVYGM